MITLKDLVFKNYLKEQKEDEEKQDLNKNFQVAIIPDKGAVVVKQLFGYTTKYPIFIETKDELKDKIMNTKSDFDIDLISVEIESGNALILTVQVEGNESYIFKIRLSNGKESIELQ